jgi:hypothetical protein
LSLILILFSILFHILDREGGITVLKMAMDGLQVEHTEFMTWAISQGVEINGVTPARFPGRGLGLVTDRTVKV